MIAIDGDVDGARGRLRQIEGCLIERDLDPKALEDRLAICVPTRSIETWILWFQGRRDLDENTSYKHEVRSRIESRKVADLWFAPIPEAQSAQESAQLTSLVHGRQEIDRLKDAAKN